MLVPIVRMKRALSCTVYVCLAVAVLVAYPIMRLATVFDEDNIVRDESRPSRIVHIARTAPPPPTDQPISERDRQQMMQLPPAVLVNLNQHIQQLNDTQDGFYYFAMVNVAFIKMVVNFLCNVRAFDDAHILDRLLLLSTDEMTCARLRQDWSMVRCIDYVAIDNNTRLSRDLRWGQHAYIHFLTLRSIVLAHLASQNVTFALIEPDAVWNRDPTAYFRDYSSEADILVPIKGYPDHGLTLTFNPMIVHPSESTTYFFQQMSARLLSDATLYDQDVLDAMCKMAYGGCVCQTFAWDDVADGLWYKLSEHERNTLTPYVINNNYIIGLGAKITRQALNGQWFLDTNGQCDAVRARAYVHKQRRRIARTVLLTTADPSLP